MIKEIKRLPLWIRHTPYCPLKALRIHPDYIPTDAGHYFAFLFAFRELPEVQAAIYRALSFSTKETEARKEFRKFWNEAPLALRDRFPSNVYQTQRGRNEFYRAYNRLERYPSPAGFGSDNAPHGYHVQRQVFKLRRRNPLRHALPNNPQKRGPAFA